MPESVNTEQTWGRVTRRQSAVTVAVVQYVCTSLVRRAKLFHCCLEITSTDKATAVQMVTTEIKVPQVRPTAEVLFFLISIFLFFFFPHCFYNLPVLKIHTCDAITMSSFVLRNQTATVRDTYGR